MKIAEGWSVRKIVVVGPGGVELEITECEGFTDWEVTLGGQPLFVRGFNRSWRRALRAALKVLADRGAL
jgi:hypothetical protein